MKLLKNWFKAGPTVLNWAPQLKDLTLEARSGLNEGGEKWVYLFDDGMPVWNCNETYFFSHFFQVKNSGKNAA